MNRFRFLKLLYEKTGADEHNWMSMWDIGQQLGFDKDETSSWERGFRTPTGCGLLWCTLLSRRLFLLWRRRVRSVFTCPWPQLACRHDIDVWAPARDRAPTIGAPENPVRQYFRPANLLSGDRATRRSYSEALVTSSIRLTTLSLSRISSRRQDGKTIAIPEFSLNAGRTLLTSTAISSRGRAG